MFKINGLDEAMKKLNDLQKKAESINKQSVPISEVLTPSFLLRHTPFGSAEEMYEASGFRIETPEDFEAVPDDEWDAFIRSISSFADWQSMLNEAGKEWATKKLGLK
jgi:hypothetical protein